MLSSFEAAARRQTPQKPSIDCATRAFAAGAGARFRRTESEAVASQGQQAPPILSEELQGKMRTIG